LKGGIEKDLDLLVTRSILVKMLQQCFIMFNFMGLFQMRPELEKILKVPDCTKAMKEAFRETFSIRR